jgi:transposase
MWKPYLLVVAEKAGQALNILDRFHIMSHMNKAIDKVRTTEVKALKAKGKKAVLTGSRWCLLKRPENCTVNQTSKLKELVAIKPEDRPSLPPQGGFPAILGLQKRLVGDQIYG